MVLTSIVRRYGSRDRKINLVDFIIVMSKLIVMFSEYNALLRSRFNCVSKDQTDHSKSHC